MIPPTVVGDRRYVNVEVWYSDKPTVSMAKYHPTKQDGTWSRLTKTHWDRSKDDGPIPEAVQVAGIRSAIQQTEKQIAEANEYLERLTKTLNKMTRGK
jgi:hypothetical protein